jgi:hypothetical protein
MTDILSDALRNVAMIAEVDTSALGLTRTDKNASKKSEADHHAMSGTARVVVQRFAGVDDLPKKIMDYQKAAHDLLKSKSTAWGSGKRRLLPNANAQDFIQGYAQIEVEYDKAVKEFVDNADAIIAQAKANQGDFQIDIPTKEEIEKAYALRYTLEPVPDGAQFKGSEAVVADLRQHFEERIKASYIEAQQDALQRLADPLKKMIERMEAFEQRERDLANGKTDVGKNGIFRDTIISNIQDIASVFGSFNLTNDPKLAEIASKIALFEKVTADTMRNRPDIRGAAVKHAKSIIEELDDMLI